jgi:hydroxyacylglutathione hydrolase
VDIQRWGALIGNMEQPALEDSFADVLGKALAGAGLSKLELMQQSGLSMLAIEATLAGHFDEEVVAVFAGVLGLSAERVCALGRGLYPPPPVIPPGLTLVSQAWPPPPTGIPQMWVNGYALACPFGGGAVIVDPGPALAPWADHFAAHGGTPVAILCTHGHGDHVTALPAMRHRWPDVPVYAHPRELVAGSKPVVGGQSLTIGGLELRVLDTPGHSPGGLSFHVAQSSPHVVFVGDCLFAGSVGGIRQDYNGTLHCVRERVLGLAPDTVVCPGHGPLTTVRLELDNNPFF